MKVIIHGKRWDLSFCRVPPDRLGDCDSPDATNKGIRVSKDLRGEKALEITLHELFHAANWRTSEEYVEREARDIARILWRLGYRKDSE
jgi:hypothetical protein